MANKHKHNYNEIMMARIKFDGFRQSQPHVQTSYIFIQLKIVCVWNLANQKAPHKIFLPIDD